MSLSIALFAVLAGARKEPASDIQAFYDRPADPKSLARNFTGAKFEPIYGCYVGASVDKERIRTAKTDPQSSRTYAMVGDDKRLDRDPSSPGSEPANPTNFAREVGKKHAIFFSYFPYRDVDAARWNLPWWLSTLKRGGAGAQVALEPRSLDTVVDDDNLHRIANIFREAEIPIFLRFASEMNGGWVSYSGNPALYKEKFALVAKVMHEEAPNVAMVWCPNETPEKLIDRYFPGDEWVDWVGVDFYSVIYSNGKRAPVRNPTNALDYVYRRYAARHPMMVCEWAASHYSSIDHKSRPEFAEDQIARFYGTLPRLYPRVKAVSWLCMNPIIHAPKSQATNDYSLLDNARVKTAYGKALADPYFLSEVPTTGHPVAPFEAAPLNSGTILRGVVRLTSSIRRSPAFTQVRYRIDSTMRALTPMAGAHEYRLDTRRLRNGRHRLTVELLDGRRQIACAGFDFSISN